MTWGIGSSVRGGLQIASASTYLPHVDEHECSTDKAHHASGYSSAPVGHRLADVQDLSGSGDEVGDVGRHPGLGGEIVHVSAADDLVRDRG